MDKPISGVTAILTSASYCGWVCCNDDEFVCILGKMYDGFLTFEGCWIVELGFVGWINELPLEDSTSDCLLFPTAEPDIEDLKSLIWEG